MKTLQKQEDIATGSSITETEYKRLKYVQHALNKTNRIMKFKVDHYRFKINELGNQLAVLNM